ncbi:bifunctional DNA primase/polymerase [Streptomyces oceani]|uniref:DNA primase n=1 Tax=Streptomyces oceani TaxID=1075402 RepID=A0A1E7KMQ4_9ACTN|nr:bifunctional DNA primase/polymerase [Streptomyces oceani]OEV05101.1 DNA primase [Streptomyces oceani]
MEDVIEVTTQPPTRSEDESPLAYALRYATERHWEVLPGTWLESRAGILRCSCGHVDCPQPGAHPAGPRWANEVTSDATVVRRLWSQRPGASVLLPTGHAFDVIDVPESAGCLAAVRMERLGVPPGPVMNTPDGRMLFLVQPGAEAEVPGMLRGLGWAPGALNLYTLGEGAWVGAPPTQVGGRGSVRWVNPRWADRRWVNPPTAADHWLPQARSILPPLAYACGREAAAARGH